jgi:hypothetical protein
MNIEVGREEWGNDYSLRFYIQGHYQKYNLPIYKATNTNQGKID